MDKYIIKYQKSTGSLNDIHPSWYELCEKQTKDIIVKILKKHLFDEGEYTFCFYAHNGKISRKHNQKFFKGCIVRKDDSECDINALALLIKAIGKSKLPIKEMILR